jgi:hypothetical protein
MVLRPHITHRVIAAAINPQYASARQTAGLKHLSRPSFQATQPTEKIVMRTEECTGVSELLVNGVLTPPDVALFPTKRFMIDPTSEKNGNRI